MNDIVVGVAMTQINAGGINMRSALQKLGWNAHMLGLGQKWSGWMMRMTMYADFAESQDPNTIIVFVDAYDALVVRTPDGFRELFESFACDIVVGAEHYCHGNCSPIDQ